ncbi:hypothetical protein FHS95_002533 [Sphingomonas naasensis]|uniref:Uncharacterized protein n=1 Tax=Sphingomonas naasensis TaxID=1344951 RepID=A0A4V3QWN5_9SPHN|nr:hypothetical protein [Sphingomonas naasensis]NIJ20841.1 hypothetical protein [Sphingomonas naasensis]TGX43242.1 hypothetical protein E5A74_08710 [Sphingomonas naasensis]
MRVVQDPAGGAAAGRRRADPVTIDADPNSFEVVGGAGNAAAAGVAGAAAGKPGLPLLPAGLFLLACAAGGVLVAVVRPLGLG